MKEESKQKFISKIPIVVSIISGVLSVILVRFYINRVESDLHKDMKAVKVVSVSVDIKGGTVLSEGMLAVSEVPRKFLQERAVFLSDYKFIIGQQVTGSLKKGNIILWSDLEESTEENKLSNIIIKGERAFTISTSTISSQSEMIRPNDHIDIIATFNISQIKTDSQGEETEEMETITITLLQNVTVLATGKRMAVMISATQSSREYNAMTLLVTQEEAQELIFAQNKGILTFVLRNVEDIETNKKFPWTRFKSILKEEYRQKIQKKRDKRIEIIRGKR